MRKMILAGMAVAAALTIAPAHAGDTTETYVAGIAGDFVNQCAEDNPTGENIAAACVGTPGAGRAVTVTATDDVSGAVDFFWIWMRADGTCVGEDPDDPTAACPNAGFGYGSQRLIAPSGAARLEIWVSGPAFATLNSVLDGTDGGFGLHTGKVRFVS